LFVNLEERLNELDLLLEQRPEKIFRIGTGEFTDSLAMDPIAHWSETLLPFFSRRKNAILELKTKTDQIQGLLQSRYRERIVVSWSLNSPFIAATEEHGAPSLEKRLQAARKCQEEGFVLGFHFDPMIHHRDWKEGYKRTVELLDRYINPQGIIWTSLGALRFMPHLKGIIRRRHPGTAILDGEFVPGLDGKMRYFKPIRLELFSFMAETLCAWHRDPGLYLCMESDEVWDRALGWSPGHSKGLSRYLDGRVTDIFT
jgi:spore photoproduct lyase